jgi:hypothetical protein
VHGTPAQPPISTASKSLCLSFDPQCNSPSIAVKYRDVPTPPVRLDSGAIKGKVGALHQVNLRTVSWKPRKPSTGTGSGQATLISTPLHHATPTSRATFRGGTTALQFHIAKSIRERIPFEPTNYLQPETNRASSTRLFAFLCPISDGLFESQVALQPRLLTVRCTVYAELLAQLGRKSMAIYNRQASELVITLRYVEPFGVGEVQPAN